MRDFVQPRGGASDLRRSVGLFVGGGPDLLRELVHFSDDIGNFAQGRIQLSARCPRAPMISPEELMVVLMRVRPSVAFSIVAMPLCTSSRERLEMSSNTFAVSATRWIEATIWSIEADVSLTLEACTCVLFTMFCTLTLISCMVLVTSSIAEEVCKLILADSSEAPATCDDALATCVAASRTFR